MTDREAIQQLAAIVAAWAAKTADVITARDEARRLLAALAEPAAPTVTREQVTEVVTPALAVWVRHSVKMAWEDELGAMPHLPEWPAFFRAVADALEGE